jgi:hypothetical protein
MLKKHDYVSLELAKKLKKAGYKDFTDARYRKEDEESDYELDFAPYFNPKGYAAPTLYEAMIWLRKKKIIVLTVDESSLYNTQLAVFKCDANTNIEGVIGGRIQAAHFEAALAIAIERAVDYLIEQRNNKINSLTKRKVKLNKVK